MPDKNIIKISMQFFADTVTKVADLIVPEVMSDYIRVKLVDLIKFSPLATIDTTLEGRAGDTVTLPQYQYIGDAADVAEGAAIPITNLSATSTSVKVKKAGKGLDITDEALLSAYGDPMGTLTNQIATSLAQKVDNDCIVALNGIKSAMTVDVSATDVISAGTIADALVKFGEDLDGSKVLLIAPAQLSQIRKDPDYINGSEIATGTMTSGSIGMIWGCEVQISNKVKATAGKFTNFIVKPGALAIFMKRAIQIETARNITNKTTRVTADEHYATYLLDESKAIKLIVKEKAAEPVS